MLLRLENSYNSMAANMRHLERIANNLANANTVGYRQDRIFTEVLNEEIDAEGGPLSTRRMQQWADHRAGSLEATGNPLDVAFDRDDFFVLNNPETGESQYTRAGRFILSEDGALQTPKGLFVEGTSGQIDFPPEGGDIEAQGFEGRFGHALGHGTGLVVHEPRRLSPLSDSLLAEGMLVTVEPGIYIPDWGGVRIENQVVVRRDRAENLTGLDVEIKA